MIGRLVAALFTVLFAMLAIPYLVLTTGHILAGLEAGPRGLVVYFVYILVLVVLAIFWFRQLRRRAPR